jgi:hypothetical protein
MFQCLVIYISRDANYYVHVRARYILLCYDFRLGYVCELEVLGANSQMKTLLSLPSKTNSTDSTIDDA